MTSSPFDRFILENGFVLLDGGLATELEAQVSANLLCSMHTRIPGHSINHIISYVS